MPARWATAFETLRNLGPYILMALVLVGRFTNVSVFSYLLDKPMSSIFTLLTGWKL